MLGGGSRISTSAAVSKEKRQTPDGASTQWPERTSVRAARNGVSRGVDSVASWIPYGHEDLTHPVKPRYLGDLDRVDFKRFQAISMTQVPREEHGDK